MWFGPSGVTPYDFIQTGTYSTWHIEVDYAAGQQPDSSLLATLGSRMREVVAASKTVDVRLSSTAFAATDRTWTVETLIELDRTTLNQQTGGSTVATHLIFVDGHYETDTATEKVLGVSIKGGLDHGLVVIFSQTLANACTLPTCLPGQIPGIKRAVVIHEFGHELGLVDNGIPMQTNHEDPEHPGHSTNTNSVMYWAVESNAVIGVLGGDPPDQFDANDKADLKAAGGR